MSENAFSLIVCLPGEEPARHDLAGDSVTFGRSPENQIQMLVAEVSVRHGRLDRDGDVYRIVDPGSTNGTRLNGAPVGPEGVPLKPMDRLVIGTVVNAYFVPAAILASTSPADLVASLEASKAPATPKTAPVAVSAAPATPAAPAAPGAPAAPVRPGVPAAPGAPARAAIPVGGPPAPPTSPGGATVKLDQVRGPGVKPAAIPAPPRPPATGVPAAPATPARPRRRSGTRWSPADSAEAPGTVEPHHSASEVSAEAGSVRKREVPDIVRGARFVVRPHPQWVRA
jgi:hypothetical protein